MTQATINAVTTFVEKLKYYMGELGYTYLNQKRTYNIKSPEFKNIKELMLILPFFTSGNYLNYPDQLILQYLDFFNARYNLDTVPYIAFPSLTNVFVPTEVLLGGDSTEWAKYTAVEDIKANGHSLLNLNKLKFITGITNPVITKGEATWDEDLGTLSLGLNENVNLQIGQEQLIYAKAGQAISNGDVVYASNAVGASGKLVVNKFIANGSIPPMQTLGIATEDIADGEFGYITTFGNVRGIQTDGVNVGEIWNEFTILYPSASVAGRLTNVAPIAPNLTIPIAVVVNPHGNNGTIFVRAYEFGHTVGTLHDVHIENIENNHIIKWNSVNSRFENSLLNTNHNNFDSLQGGQSGEYYHLSLAQYNNITNWDTAYSWGNHALVGYLTVESDPIFTAWNRSDGISITSSQVSDFNASVALAPSVVANTAKISFPGFSTLLADYGFTDNSANWDVAYSWGNHATQGYLTSVTTGAVTLLRVNNLSDLENTSTARTNLGVAIGVDVAAFSHTHSASEITSGTFSNTLISQSSVTQHQAALSISFSQLTDKPTTLSGYGITDSINSNQIGVANGLATLDSNAKVTASQLPDYLLGQVLYGGTVNASTATATLSSNAKSKLGTTNNTIVLTNSTAAITGYSANEGIYYITTVDGSFAGISFAVGDWLISNGSAWTKVDNTDAVTSVAGKTGAVSLTKSDVGLSLVENTALSSWAGSTSITTLGAITTGSIPWNNVSSKPTEFNPVTATSTILGGIKLGSNTQQIEAANAVTATVSRTYAIQVNAAGQAVVNVPWSGTTGTVTSVSGTGTVNGLTLTGTVTTSGSLTLGGTLSVPASQVTAGTFGAGDYTISGSLTAGVITSTNSSGSNTLGIFGGTPSSTQGDAILRLYSYNAVGANVSQGTIRITQDAAGDTRAGKMVFATRQSGGTITDALIINSTQDATFSSSLTAGGDLFVNGGNVGIGTTTLLNISAGEDLLAINKSQNKINWLRISNENTGTSAASGLYFNELNGGLTTPAYILYNNSTHTTRPSQLGFYASAGLYFANNSTFAGTLGVTGAATFSGSLTASGGNSSEWNTAYDRSLSSLSFNDGYLRFTEQDASNVDASFSTHIVRSPNEPLTDFNSATSYAFMTSINASANTPFGNGWYSLINVRHRGGSGDGNQYGLQIANGMVSYNERIAFRNHDVGVWTSWYEFFHTGHLPTWSEVSGKPTTFTPSSHTHAASDITAGTFSGSFTFANDINYNSAIRWKATINAYQRADARDDATDKARLYWYGRNSADTANDRVRWNLYDGTNYTPVDVVNRNVIFGHQIMSGNTDGEGIRLSHTYSNGNTSSRLFHIENDNELYGFSWVYAGVANPIIDGNTFTLADNTYNLIRHNNSAAGSTVLSVGRASNDVTFTGLINASGANFSGGVVINTGSWNSSGLKLTGTAPSIYFSQDDDWNVFIGINGRSFFLLDDTNNDGNFESSPYPFQIDMSTNMGYINGSRIWADNYHPVAAADVSAGTFGGTSYTINGSLTLGSVILEEATDRAELLRIRSSTNSWSGIQIGNNTEDLWSFMADGDTCGIYNDTTNEWHIICQDNSYVRLYHNNTIKLETSSVGITVTGTGTATNWIGTSDARLKEDWDYDVDYKKAIQDIARSAGHFTWKESGVRDFGIKAQDILGSAPYLVFGTEETQYGVAYNKISVLNSIMLDNHEDRLTTLENENKLLKQKLAEHGITY